MSPTKLKPRNILRVAKAIERSMKMEKPDIGFRMDEFVNKRPGRELGVDSEGHFCKTTACVAGFAGIIANGPPKTRLQAQRRNWEAEGQKFFGLTDSEAGCLFYAGERGICNVDAELAVKVLRHLAKTGKVDWNFESWLR